MKSIERWGRVIASAPEAMQGPSNGQVNEVGL
jgi:hypothetical protein